MSREASRSPRDIILHIACNPRYFTCQSLKMLLPPEVVMSDVILAEYSVPNFLCLHMCFLRYAGRRGNMNLGLSIGVRSVEFRSLSNALWHLMWSLFHKCMYAAGCGLMSSRLCPGFMWA